MEKAIAAKLEMIKINKSSRRREGIRYFLSSSAIFGLIALFFYYYNGFVLGSYLARAKLIDPLEKEEKACFF